MLSILIANPLPFILALIIGLATAWWVWSSPTEAEDDVYDEVFEEEPVAEEPVVVEEIAEPSVEEVEETVVEPEPVEPEPVKKAAPVAAAAATAAAVKPRAKAPKPLDVSEIDDKDTKIASGPAIAAAVGPPDDLTRIKGIGPKLHELCISLGVKRFDQIAAWTSRDVKAVDEHLGSFKGRITRDAWVAQAKLLADGRVTEHQSIFGS